MYVFLNNVPRETYELDNEYYVDRLLEKHAETIKEVTFDLTTRRNELFDIVLKYVTYLPNVEKMVVTAEHLSEKRRFNCYSENEFEDPLSYDEDDESSHQRSKKLSKKKKANKLDLDKVSNSSILETACQIYNYPFAVSLQRPG